MTNDSFSETSKDNSRDVRPDTSQTAFVVLFSGSRTILCTSITLNMSENKIY